MNQICFEINSNEEIWNLIDKRAEHILIHKFNPNESIVWWRTNVKMINQENFEDIQVRNMEFDIQTNLNGLKKVLDLNTSHLSIYQFDKPISDTLVLENLPESNKEKILRNNGLQHIYFCDFEFLTIQSFDSKFLTSVENNELFRERILKRKELVRNQNVL